MNLRDMECFFAVADHLQFSRAAEAVHLSQSSVSEAVARLERTLGAALLRRTSRRVELTPFGQRFLDDVRPAYDELMVNYLNTVRVGHQEHELRIGHTPELGHLIFPGLLTHTAEDSSEPEVEWKPYLMHTHQQLAALAAGEIDIGICWQPSVDPPLTSAVLAQCPMILIARDDDELAQRDEISLRDLRDRRLLVSARADNRFTDARVAALLDTAGIPQSAIEEVARYDELTVNVVRRKMIALHPATIAQHNRVPGVAFRELLDPGLNLNIAVVSRAPVPAPPEFLDRLRAVTLDTLESILVTLGADEPH